MTVEEAAVVLGIARATSYDAVSREPWRDSLHPHRQAILIPKVALDRLLDGAGEAGSSEAKP